MQTDREHRLRDNLGRTFLYTRWPQFEEDRQLRKEAVIRYKVFAQQHFQVIAESGTDPFHYGLLDLWLDLYREPWAQPRTLAKLVDDLAEKIASGDLRVYLEDSLMWRHVSSGNSNGGGGAPTPRVDQYDEVRSQDAAYTPHPDVKEPRMGERVFKRLHHDGHPDDRYTLQSNGKPLGADEGSMPTHLEGMKELPPNHDEMVAKGWPTLNFRESEMYKTFISAEPVELAPGTKIIRIIDEKNNDAGPFWSQSRAPSKSEWRRGSAVKDTWNDNGYYVEHIVGPGGLKAWLGPAAGQQYDEFEGREYYLAGGDTQLFITPGAVKPTAPKLTDWPEA